MQLPVLFPGIVWHKRCFSAKRGGIPISSAPGGSAVTSTPDPLSKGRWFPTFVGMVKWGKGNQFGEREEKKEGLTPL